MKCSACGHQLAAVDTFCSSCGTPMSADSGSELTLSDEITLTDEEPPPPSPAGPSVGNYTGTLRRLLGAEYELLAPIGEGGFARVYKARDRRLDRIVAIKVIR
ncbi:MAG: zinc-ribbon domain-containing protein, partial [Gemmatimonadetes bacterium]|nr:zinc-ribbon domain-containing protein [Gemmatimonadota bacterium]